MEPIDGFSTIRIAISLPKFKSPEQAHFMHPNLLKISLNFSNEFDAKQLAALQNKKENLKFFLMGREGGEKISFALLSFLLLFITQLTLIFSFLEFLFFCSIFPP